MHVIYLSDVSVCTEGDVYFSGSCYHYEQDNLDYDAHVTSARDIGAKLVSINSAAEARLVYQLFFY